MPLRGCILEVELCTGSNLSLRPQTVAVKDAEVVLTIGVTCCRQSRKYPEGGGIVATRVCH